MVFRCRRLYWIFWKKSFKKIKYSRSSPDTENYWCGNQQSYNFFLVFVDFRTLPDNSVDSKQIFFSRLSQKKKFLEPMEKNPYIVNCWWNCVSNYVYSTILVITKVYIFLLVYFTSALLLIMRSQSSSIAWTVTSTTALYHCWSYTKHSDLWIRCIAYIWYLHSLSIWDMRIYLIFDLINVNNT